MSSWRGVPRGALGRALLAGLAVTAGCRPTEGHDAHRQGLRQTVPSATTPTVSPPPPDWHGILGTGQSLSVGAEASALRLTTQPFHNLKLSLGDALVDMPPYDPRAPGLTMVPLVEPIRRLATLYPGAYPLNIFGETPHTAMGSQISDMHLRAAGQDYVTVHSVVGESGQAMKVIDATAVPTLNRGHAYAASLFEVRAIAGLAKAAGARYRVDAVVLTHGESDSANAAYEADMVRLLASYQRDIPPITGQSNPVLLLTTQQQTCPADNSTQASILAEWRIGVDYPKEVVCVGPKYQYAYAADHLHLIAAGYDELGEKYGEVYYERVVLGHDWRPLEPIEVVASETSVRVRFHVPVAPLAWDDVLPAPHQTAHPGWAPGRGFELQDEQGEVPIRAVSVEADTVRIDLGRSPSRPLRVAYALTQDGSGSQGGLSTGRIGQLRDSNPRVGLTTGKRLYNYALSFAWKVD